MLSQHRQLVLGKSKSKEQIYFPLARYGSVLIVSRPRTGKSAMVKSLAQQIYNSGRPMLICDCLGKGEWSATRKVNYSASDPRAIDKLKVLRNFALPLNAFKTFDDFSSLGFADESASYMVRWVRKKHLQNPKNMGEFLDALPVSTAMLQGFNERYIKHGLVLKNLIFYQTRSSLISRWARIRHWFWKGKADKRMVLDAKLLQRIWVENPWLCLQIDMGSGEEYKSCAYLGNLLSNLDDGFLKEMSPVIIVEEADLICPHMTINNRPLTSRNILRYFVNKKLRFGILLFFITQTERLLDEEVVRSCSSSIVGLVNRKSQFYEKAKYNRMRHSGGVSRSTFTYININNYSKNFLPKVCSCGCWS